MGCKRLMLIPLLAGLMPPLAGSQDSQEPPTFSVTVSLVKVPVSVFGENGAPELRLHAGDFRLYEDGVAQSIRSFGVDQNPVSVVLVLDTSATVEKELDRIKQAARDFVRELSPQDRLSIIAFSDEASRILDWTENRKAFQRALRQIEPGVRTALYDAMFMAADDMLRGIEGRKAIILLTDMLNNQSRVTFEQAAKAIIQSQASLYVVSKTAIVRKQAMSQRRVVWLHDIYRRMFGGANYVEEFFRKREAEMTDLAEKTGGRCLFPPDFDQIGSAYGEIARELKSQYYLTYVSNQQLAPDSYHRITVEYAGSASKLIFRQGYYFQPQRLRRPIY
ncbi:MAG: VWA domain-containing protein [Acidobacteria bacterium]|nr:VWA domain-containing protein [Acidobacteriota bacterium]